jgi:hypothetical protein
MTSQARYALAILLLVAAAESLAGWRARPRDLGQPREVPACSVTAEIAGEGVVCLDSSTARARSLVSGDRIDATGVRSRMVPARLELFAVPVSVNHAAVDELASLPGIGAKLAARIAAARPFSAIEEVARVPGVGPRRLAAIRARLEP